MNVDKVCNERGCRWIDVSVNIPTSFVKNPDKPILLGHTEPEVHLWNNVFYLYYRTDHSIALATSTDGLNWAEQGIVLSHSVSGWDDLENISPSVLFYNGTYYLYYEGASTTGARAVGVATSLSPLGPFIRPVPNIPTLAPTLPWEDNIVGTPAITQIGSIFYLFYHGFNGINDQVGVAYGSTPTGPWLKEANNPILPYGASGAWDSVKTAPSSCVALFDSVILVFYEGFNGTNWQTGLAIGVPSPIRVTTLTRVANNPIIPLGPTGSFDAYDTQLPGAVSVGNECWLYYSGNDGAAFHLARAISSYITTDD